MAVAVAVAMAAKAAAGTEATEKPKADARKRKVSTKLLLVVLYKRNVLETLIEVAQKAAATKKGQ